MLVISQDRQEGPETLPPFGPIIGFFCRYNSSAITGMGVYFFPFIISIMVVNISDLTGRYRQILHFFACMPVFTE